MRFHQIFLKFAQVFFRNLNVAERSESGGDSINGFTVVFKLVVEVIATVLYFGFGLFRKDDFQVVAEDLFNSFEVQRLRTYCKSIHSKFEFYLINRNFIIGHNIAPGLSFPATRQPCTVDFNFKLKIPVVTHIYTM